MYTTTTVSLSNIHCTRYRILSPLSPFPVPSYPLSSCVRTIEHALFALQPAPVAVDVSIVYKSVALRHPHALSLPRIHAALHNAGFDLLSASPPSRQRVKHAQQCSLCQRALHEKDAHTPDTASHILTLSVGGMTCSSCVATITDMLSRLPGISDVVISLLGSSATLRVENKNLVSSVIGAIDDCGFQVELISAEPILPSPSTSQLPPAGQREISLRVDGMYCQ